MKKLLCIALCLMTALTAVSALPATAAADDVLTVTVNGKDPVKVAVGNEFLFYVGLYAGDVKILNGQVHLEYDPDSISFVEHTAYSSVLDDTSAEGYSFPNSLNRSSIILNDDNAGEVNYNFTNINGVAVFNDPDKLFTRFRFKATAAGTTDIGYIIQYMLDVDKRRIYYDGAPDTGVDPYTVITVLPSKGCVGDADGDYDVTIMDATLMQRLAGGAKLSYNTAYADVSGDGAVSLRDAVIVRRYLASKDVDSAVGTHLYDSDKA